MSGFGIEIDFEFEIGETVYHRAGMNWEGSMPKRFVIVQRVAEQCIGGVQLHYVISDGGTMQVSELELTREMPKYIGHLDRSKESWRALREEFKDIQPNDETKGEQT